MIRLPARYYVVPIDAEFRPDQLPPELKSTWHLLRALSWVNDYRFTPPVSIAELLVIHFRLGSQQRRDKALLERLKRTLINHLNRLEATGWLKIERAPGQKNIYRPIVPPPSANTAICAESASISSLDEEDSSQFPEPANASDIAIDNPASETGFTSPNVVVVGTDLSHSVKNQHLLQQQQLIPDRSAGRSVGGPPSAVVRPLSASAALSSAAIDLIEAYLEGCPRAIAENAVAAALARGDSLKRIELELISWVTYAESPAGKGIQATAIFAARKVERGERCPAFRYRINKSHYRDGGAWERWQSANGDWLRRMDDLLDQVEREGERV